MTIAQETLIDQEHEEEIDDQLEEEDNSVPLAYDISSYGADYPVDSLVKRISAAGEPDIIIPPFQRKYIWPIKRASRFIESLLLGLPVPGIFLATDPDTQQLNVIDGQQRLRTLQYFYNGVFEPTGKPFVLKGVQPQFEGKTYSTLEARDRRKLDNSILHATVVKQENPEDDDSSIYHIFERLNTGGMQLTPQEIRASIYHGAFNDLLNQLNGIPEWRSVYGRVSPRMKDQELILRFFALYFQAENYTKPLKEFLNAFMRRHRHLNKDLPGYELGHLFKSTIEVVHQCLGTKAFRPIRNLHAAVYDAGMVGIARRLDQGIIQDCALLRTRYEELLKNEDFIQATDASSDVENVRRRLALATQVFADIP